MTETAEVTANAETTEFQRAVLRAMLELAGSNTSNEIATRVGAKPEPVRVSLARMRDNGLIDTEANPDKGGPPLWYLRVSAATVRQMLAANPATVANDGTPGDDEPMPEPGDTQAASDEEPSAIAHKPAALEAAPSAVIETAPDADGWIPWHGGERPVDADQRVAIRLVSGKMLHGRAGDFIWSWNFCDSDCADYTTGGNIVAYRLDTPAHLITPAYSAAVTAESAADAALLTGDDVCSADAVIANWKREHAPAAPAAPADPDTPLGCAIARITGPLIAQAEEWESDALRLRHIIGEAIRLASDAQARTPGVSEAHKALEIAASIIEDVQ